MTDVEVRDATAADLDAVVALETALFGVNAWSRSAMAAELAGLDHLRVALVARSAADLVGYGVLLTVGDTADLQRIGVASDHQGRGVGARLLAALIERSAAAGCSRLILEVAAHDARAGGFYERHGFAEVARRPRYYPDGADAVVMRRDVEPHVT